MGILVYGAFMVEMIEEIHQLARVFAEKFLEGVHKEAEKSDNYDYNFSDNEVEKGLENTGLNPYFIELMKLRPVLTKYGFGNSKEEIIRAFYVSINSVRFSDNHMQMLKKVTNTEHLQPNIVAFNAKA